MPGKYRIFERYYSYILSADNEEISGLRNIFVKIFLQ